MQPNVNIKSVIVLIACAFIAIGFFGSQWGPWVSGGPWSVQAILFPAWVGLPYFISLIALYLLRGLVTCFPMKQHGMTGTSFLYTKSLLLLYLYFYNIKK